DRIAVPFTDGRGRPLTDSVGNDDGRLLERAAEERRSGVRLVVPAEEDVPLEARDALFDHLRHLEFLLNPEGNRPLERPIALERILQIRLEEPTEGQDGVVVVGDAAQIGRLDACFLQAESDGGGGEALITLAAGKPLLLGRRDQLPIPQEAGRAVVIEGGDPQDISRHQGLPNRDWPTAEASFLPITTNSPPSVSSNIWCTWLRRRSRCDPRGSGSKRERR